ncbi:hypothetical protein AVEN_10007-1 [Araneus ventricosus]|uniref:Uncharacterized protein n=1 Tax=Araneus ventricosus TaxID=182803 RepID=A0A4Y2LVQ1_ARAVE|nr:hypothetical protein AVEN_10007-1 [Araneus ventricosus]
MQKYVTTQPDSYDHEVSTFTEIARISPEILSFPMITFSLPPKFPEFLPYFCDHEVSTSAEIPRISPLVLRSRGFHFRRNSPNFSLIPTITRFPLPPKFPEFQRNSPLCWRDDRGYHSFIRSTVIENHPLY